MANINKDDPGGDWSTHGKLEALQQTFTANRRARPPPMDVSTIAEDRGRMPLKEPQVQRRESKGGLRSIFTRNKVDKTNLSTALEEGAPISGISERSMRAVAEAGLRRSFSLRRTKTGTETLPATPMTPIRPASRSSRIGLRTRSIRQTKPPSKASPNSNKSGNRSASRTSPVWDPPPLFQAYPQAVKHAQLSASTLSADAILRMSNHNRSNSLRDEITQSRMGHAPEQTAAARKSENKRARHRRQLSGSISKADWTQKIFVLVTSGYLLQYAGEGSFDRLPEKMMQLGKDSVAFASDVIPGKHWVLQISQKMDADGTPAADSRSLLSRLAFRGADYRRTATSLLLVLNSAEEMDSWLAVVRREIEALGGKKHASETGKPKPDDKVLQLRTQPSHRYLVTRDPDQFNETPTSPQLQSWVKEKDNELQQKLDEAMTAMTGPQLPRTRPLTGDQSIANSFTSHGERQLDNLRDSSNRFSYMSSGQRTLITSQGSSPATSPTRDKMPNFDELPQKADYHQPTMDEARPRPNSTAINERRRSMTTMVPVLEQPPAPKNFRHSTYGGGSAKNSRSQSPGTPNFSVPNSSSKRYSIQSSPVTGAPPLSASSFTARARESLLQGKRHAPPAHLKMKTRSLSPVKDTLSPKRSSITISRPTPDLSVKLVNHNRVPSVDAPPRPSREIGTSDFEVQAPKATLNRQSILKHPTENSALADFQFPRKFSSMQTLRKDQLVSESVPEEPAYKHLVTAPLSPLPDMEVKAKKSNETVRRAGTVTSGPAIANTKTKLKRPSSLQPTSTPPPPPPPPRHALRSPTPTSKSSPARQMNTLDSPTPATTSSPAATTRALVFSPSGARTIVFPSEPARASPPPAAATDPSNHFKVQVPDESSTTKTLLNRRSMPLLLKSPPPAPPPNCALPPLPPGSAMGMRSPVSVRSVRVNT